MRIFITGATGFVGAAAVADLLLERHQVVGLARTEAAETSLRHAGAEVLRGDLRDQDILRRGAQSADAVIHTAFDHDFSRMAESCELDRAAIEALGDGLIGSGKRLIVTAGLPPLVGRVSTENDVFSAGLGGTPRLSEQTAMTFVDRGVRVSVVRMPQIHDRQKQGFASYLLAHAASRKVSVYVGDGTNRWPAVHRLDAARLYSAVLHRGVPGGRYHAVTEEGVAVREIAEAIATRLGVPVASLPKEESANHFGWLDRIATMDVAASSALTRKDLLWAPKEPSNLVQDIRESI